MSSDLAPLHPRRLLGSMRLLIGQDLRSHGRCHLMLLPVRAGNKRRKTRQPQVHAQPIHPARSRLAEHRMKQQDLPVQERQPHRAQLGDAPMIEPNALVYGDNLDVLRRHIADESVDLIYLDPPFNSNANYNVLFGGKGGSRSAAQILGLLVASTLAKQLPALKKSSTATGVLLPPF